MTIPLTESSNSNKHNKSRQNANIHDIRSPRAHIQNQLICTINGPHEPPLTSNSCAFIGDYTISSSEDSKLKKSSATCTWIIRQRFTWRRWWFTLLVEPTEFDTTAVAWHLNIHGIEKDVQLRCTECYLCTIIKRGMMLHSDWTSQRTI